MRGIVWAYITEDANQKLLEIEANGDSGSIIEE